MNETTASQDAQVELLGLIAGASLSAFEQTAAASALTEDVAARLVLARIAAQRLARLDGIEAELTARGARVVDAVEPFRVPLSAFARHAAARDHGEALVRLCVLGGLAADFVARVRAHLDDALAGALDRAVDDGGLRDEPARLLGAVLAADPDQQGALAMYARRLLGETFSQTQRVCAARPALTQLVTGCDEGDDLAAIGDLMAELAGSHAKRLATLGLA